MSQPDDDLDFIAISESAPGEKMRTLFEAFWPAYERWFLQHSGKPRPSYARCMRALREHMPEILPVYEDLCELLDADDRKARFLSLFRPAPFLTGCSQAIWKRQPLSLIRNYDYAARFTDGVNLHSAWSGVLVIAMTDCFWGALDGINEHGLTVALAFGGRKVVGDGFAIPVILRYILETCRSTGEAVQVLQRVPSHMAYNVSVLDKTAEHATVFVAPDRPAEVTHNLVCANHQQQIDWPEHARMTASVQREAYLAAAVSNPVETYAGLLDRFMHEPLYRPIHFKRWRTLYTAAYLPQQGVCTYLWPHDRWEQSFAHFVEHGTIEAHVAQRTARSEYG